MLAPVQLPPVALESDVRVRRKSFRQEQLAFTKGTEGSGAGGVGAFMEHRLGPIFSSGELQPERFHPQCTREAEWKVELLEVYDP
jgi:hypothetical protein